MTSFLVEAYTPATIDITAVEAQARRAAAELTEAGADVRYLRAIFVPEDELCLYLFDADSMKVVDEAARRAGISPDRIVRAVP